MFCENCGKKIPDDSAFCPECGAKVHPIAREPMRPKGEAEQYRPRQQAPMQPMQQPLTPEQQAEMRKRNRIVGIIVAAVIGVCAILGLLSVLIKPKLNLNDYISVEFDGYDTIGTAYAAFDYDSFYNTLGRNQEELGDDFLADCIHWSLDKDTKLSNGDTVTLTWDCDDEKALKEYGYKLVYENKEVKANGLSEAEIFDPFEGVTVSFDGIAPQGNARMETRPSSHATEYLRYSFDRETGLSNGDEVTLTVTSDYGDPVETTIRNNGMIPSPLSKTFKVEGLSSYVTSLKDITDDGMQAMKAQAEDTFHAMVALNWSDSTELKQLDYIGDYLLTNKNTENFGGSYNMLYLVYKVQARNFYKDEDNSYDKINSVYWYIAYSDLMVNEDGSTLVDVSRYETPSNEAIVDSGISNGWWDTVKWYYYGYLSLSDLYKDVVTAQAETYNHTDNVDESRVAAGQPAKADKASADDAKKDSKKKDATEGEAQDASGEENKTDGKEEGIIFPNSSEEVIDKSRIAELSDNELRDAINEIYARNGYIFKDDTIRAFYEQYDWYKETVKPADFSQDLFNDTETKNITAMQKERDGRK